MSEKKMKHERKSKQEDFEKRAEAFVKEIAALAAKYRIDIRPQIQMTQKAMNSSVITAGMTYVDMIDEYEHAVKEKNA